MTKGDLLLGFMAEACHNAQSHVGDPDAWPSDEDNRQYLLQCTSFQVACFLAQNTVDGEQGVDWCVAIEQLTNNTRREHGMMVRSVKAWRGILRDLVEEYGGWNDDMLTPLAPPVKGKWQAVPDSKVRHVWKCENGDCPNGNPTAKVGPDFYQESGEPMCDSDCLTGMTYVRTEVRA